MLLTIKVDNNVSDSTWKGHQIVKVFLDFSLVLRLQKVELVED